MKLFLLGWLVASVIASVLRLIEMSASVLMFGDDSGGTGLSAFIHTLATYGPGVVIGTALSFLPAFGLAVLALRTWPAFRMTVFAIVGALATGLPLTALYFVLGGGFHLDVIDLGIGAVAGFFGGLIDHPSRRAKRDPLPETPGT